MSEQNTSGSRWEPAAASEPDAPVENHLAPPPLDLEEEQPITTADEPVGGGRGRLTRTRVVAAGAAGAIFLLGGAAGYALGHGTGNDTTVGRFAGPGGDGDGDHGFGRPDLDGQQGQLPPGGQSGSGSANTSPGSANGNPT